MAVCLALASGATLGLARPTKDPTLFATAPAVVADIEETVIAAGLLEASRMVSVGAQVSGQIRSLHVDLGDEVKAGDLIAEIDSTTQQNDVRDARAALTAARAERSMELATLKRMDLAFARQKMMLAEDATSQAEFELAEAELDATRARIEALDAQIEQRQTRLDTTLANLGYTKIRAPMDGVVVAVVVKEGQTVNAMQAAPTLVKLAQLDMMTVHAEISEADVVKIEAGQPVYFTILGKPEKRFTGTLRTIEPAPKSLEIETSMSSASTAGNSNNAIYYNALFEVPNPARELRISMTAQVYIVLNAATAALTIPSVALGERTSDGRYTVRVLDAQRAPSMRAVEIGINNRDVAQVIHGLHAGEQVIVGEAAPGQNRSSPFLM
ncbi:efflux RND transporter periplasmic adaptor subunit [Peristeroidobacter soli]|uniref:efflux RND transporter periplasmic adaptor subunit n=1 Tax=Peristeroidobacter soli TaxID=2497877 RepID=UPI001C37CAA2|nr:efflux RND transporter periplasmic adaptor subunit [Peristeroidobacter soli]